MWEILFFTVLMAGRGRWVSVGPLAQSVVFFQFECFSKNLGNKKSESDFGNCCVVRFFSRLRKNSTNIQNKQNCQESRRLSEFDFLRLSCSCENFYSFRIIRVGLNYSIIHSDFINPHTLHLTWGIVRRDDRKPRKKCSMYHLFPLVPLLACCQTN